MGFGSVSLLMKINFVLIIIALVIQILGLALPYWLDFDVADAHSGLWQACSGGNCNSISNPSDKLEVSQAFSIISPVVLVAALVVAIIYIFLKDMKMLKLIFWILAFIAAFCIMIEFAVFADAYSTYSDDNDYSGAFAITIIDFVLCIVIGVIGVIDWLGLVGGKI